MLLFLAHEVYNTYVQRLAILPITLSNMYQQPKEKQKYEYEGKWKWQKFPMALKTNFPEICIALNHGYDHHFIKRKKKWEKSVSV